MDNSTLSRCITNYSDLKPETIILVGNGSICNGWDPFKQFILSEDAPLEWKTRILSDNSGRAAEVYLSNLVFKYYSSFIALFIADNEKNNQIISESKQLQSNHYSILEKIGKSFSAYPLVCRDTISIIRSLISINVGIITLNWDECLWNEPNIFQNLIQLHGRCSIPKSIILPTELAIQKWYFNMTSTCSQEIKNISIEQKMIHQYAYEWLISAKTIIIWGVAFNAYDTEISSILESAFYYKHTKLEKIININPDRKTDNLISQLFCIDKSKIEIII
jgi:hypothetical protein